VTIRTAAWEPLVHPITGQNYCRGIRVSRKASYGRQRAEDKGDSGSAFLLMKRGQLFSPKRWVGGTPIYMPLWMPRRCGSTTLWPMACSPPKPSTELGKLAGLASSGRYGGYSADHTQGMSSGRCANSFKFLQLSYQQAPTMDSLQTLKGTWRFQRFGRH
jgi:hypothetical protein